MRNRRAARQHTIRGFACAAGFCLSAVGAQAQISLTSAVDLALRSSPKVIGAQADVDRARAALSESRDAFVPVVGVRGGVGRSTGPPLGLPVVFNVSAESLVFNFQQRDFIRSAHDGLDAAVLLLQDARAGVEADVAATYVQLANAEQRRDAADEAQADAEKLATIVQERLDAGQDTHMELTHARRTRAQMRLQGLQLDDEVVRLEDHLGRLMGLGGTRPQIVAGSLPPLQTESETPASKPLEDPAVKAAFANAQSKLEVARGDARYKLRPQLGFAADYSRISTAFTNYSLYYPGFQNNFSENALSLGVELRFPILDRAHEAKAKESAAEARRARADAESAQVQFLEGRLKLEHSETELAAEAEVATLDRDLAQDQLDAVRVQLQAGASGPGGVPMTPKDEQNARLQERLRTLDLLNAELQVREAQVSLYRQTGHLTEWLKSSPEATPSTTVGPATAPTGPAAGLQGEPSPQP